MQAYKQYILMLTFILFKICTINLSFISFHKDLGPLNIAKDRYLDRGVDITGNLHAIRVIYYITYSYQGNNSYYYYYFGSYKVIRFKNLP